MSYGPIIKADVGGGELESAVTWCFGLLADEKKRVQSDLTGNLGEPWFVYLSFSPQSEGVAEKLGMWLLRRGNSGAEYALGPYGQEVGGVALWHVPIESVKVAEHSLPVGDGTITTEITA